MAEKQKTEIDARLLKELRHRAEQQGRPETEVLEEAVRRYLDAPRTLAELFDRAAQWQREHGVESLTDEEAMKLANEELHAMRRERRAER